MRKSFEVEEFEGVVAQVHFKDDLPLGWLLEEEKTGGLGPENLHVVLLDH